jgi:hypothetical protein
MTDIRTKYVPPAIDLTAFNCPHCGALAKQFWHSVHADALAKDAKPLRIESSQLDAITLDHVEDKDERQRLRAWAERVASGEPFMDSNNNYRTFDVTNVSISRCFNCDKLGIWIHSRLVWPMVGSAPVPNPDLPTDVRMDYEEAGAILNLSPRGAAALLRLAIQKLCKELGEKGKNIDDDIASLVKKGLDVRVQQALDVVRVIGNNAVHPGQIDLSDDRATAEKLFGLVNLISEVMISQPKHVSDMYASLPETALEAIERRDMKKS